MARPQNVAAYGDHPDAADLAAAYAFGLSRNHPFLDGNKRTAFVVMELFLNLNGWTLEANDAECISTMLSGAAGDLSEKKLSDWLRSHIARE
jgi:death-on-curing protein